MVIIIVDYVSTVQCAEWKLYSKGVYHQPDSEKVHANMYLQDYTINQWLSLLSKLIMCIKKHIVLSVYSSMCCLSDSVPYSQLSNATAQFLVTVVTNLSVADIQDALLQHFQSVSSALSVGLPITVSSMERYGRYSLGTCKAYSHIKINDMSWFCRWMWSNWRWTP